MRIAAHPAVCALSILTSGCASAPRASPRDLAILDDSSRTPIRILWTTDGKDLKVREPFWLRLELDPRRRGTYPRTMTFRSPMRVRIDGSALEIGECRRQNAPDSAPCEPVGALRRVELGPIEDVRVHTANADDGDADRVTRDAGIVLSIALGAAVIALVTVFSVAAAKEFRAPP